ncbi:hypothetical protein [Novosphingobium sp.]|uniref:hypothetical protein n=1 Tax=Novosphingobium sp. TaxID=1874826 RepID=UPI0031E36CD8
MADKAFSQESPAGRTAPVAIENDGAGATHRGRLLALAEMVQHPSIQALSIKQPYPHHIFHDGKDVENRNWPTNYRGWFMVHAGVSRSEIVKGDPNEEAMPRGGIVGMARITGCVADSDSSWFFGKFGFVLRDAFPLDLIPCRGQLGFFRPPHQSIEALAEALRRRAEGLCERAPA